MTQRIQPLREWRHRKGLTQVALGAKAAVDQRTISRLEAGRVQEPAHCTVIRICRVLGVEPEAVQEFRC